MERALIIGASGGIGAAVATALRSRGVATCALSRSRDGFDLTDEAAVASGQAQAAAQGPYDLVLVASGALEIDGQSPEKTLRAVRAPTMLAQFALNAVGPALVLGAAHRLLPRQRHAVLAVLSARVGSIGDNRLGGWVSYRAAKAALNQIVHTAAIELARSHPQAICAALHPGTVATGLSRRYLGRHPAVPPETAAANLLHVIDRLRPADSGGFFDGAGQPVPW